MQGRRAKTGEKKLPRAGKRGRWNIKEVD